MRRITLGLVLVVHGLAHANAGMLAANPFRIVPTLLWAIAAVGFLAAGFGLLGVRPFRRHWQISAMAGTAASLLLLGVYRPLTAWPGIAIDLVILAILFFVTVPTPWAPHMRKLATVGKWAAVAFLAYIAIVIVSRPWHSRWGSSDAELRAAMPGDDIVPNPHYTIQHAISIRAEPADVWPWLVQLGQDRGGFYSYAWLERAVGDRITIADRVHPEWQTLAEGDLIRATQPDYLGGIFGRDLGWRIVRLEPERVLTLGGWGSFILQRGAVGETRLIVRVRGAGKPNVALAPFGLLVLEPAHFIMERAMLRGIKQRVERATQHTSGNS
jgi:hypothetical protein